MISILVVEDDTMLRESLCDYLELEGYQIQQAKDGIEALRVLASQAVDLVIVDLVMPGKDGIETIREARKKYPHLKYIAMSGGGKIDSEEYLHTARLLGAIHTFKKPILMSELLAAIKEIAEKIKAE